MNATRVDKCYCRGAQIKGKKAGIIIVGGSPIGAKQYSIIKEQFDCIESYLGWDMLFYKNYYATGISDLKSNADALKELVELGKNI